MSKRNHHRKKQKHYSIFEDGSTSYNSQLPQFLLCEECRSLGYCKLTLPATDNRASTSEPRKILKKFPFDLDYYKNKIPFRVSKTGGFSEYAKKHLQIAYESFHQEDFETALLNFRSVERGGSNNNGRDYFLAVTYFLLGNYQEAACHMQASVDNTYYPEEDFTPFMEECERLSHGRKQTGEHVDIEQASLSLL